MNYQKVEDLKLNSLNHAYIINLGTKNIFINLSYKLQFYFFKLIKIIDKFHVVTHLN